ncbi:hypothetical protein [Kitasatospora sp. NPDC087314]|uniref:hypothetical protein n=1 Tax=Kitasatospora sp. NPDC087314 TaxID=3364068 RepID=UPI003820D09A
MRNGDAVRTALEAVAETLLHTHDIARGLGLPWQPPVGLCVLVLDRLFPHAPDEPGAAPADVLLWCTGRGELNGRPRKSSWNWRAAVGEWPA